jgi:glycosyltransferase involved in cell wall biosynthesis
MESKDNRPKILVAVDWFTPAYRAGGPIRSVANAVAALENEFQFFIVCGAYDLEIDGKFTALEVETGPWTIHGKAQVKYLERADWTARNWRKIFNEVQPQTLYLNSMFSGPFSRLPLAVARKLARKRRKTGSTLRVVLAPRGMLDEGALAIKPLKKYAYLSLSRAIGRYDGLVWQASGPDEERSVHRHFPRAHVLIAQNLSAQPPALDLREKTSEHYLSVGRIHPIKNQLFSAQILARRAKKTGSQILYQLVGPVEDAAYLRDVIACQGHHGKGVLQIEASGPIPPTAIPDLFPSVRALLAPSLNENFGHAIAESLSIGCPVLVSDQTPWTAEKLGGAGRQLPLEEKDWDAALDWLADETAWKEARRRALENFSSAHSDPDILAAHRKLWAP